MRNDNMNKIDSVNNEIYILGDFKINVYINDSYILAKKNILNNKSVPSDVKSYHEFRTFLGLKQLIIVLTRVKHCFKNMVIILKMSAKITTSGLLKKRVF